MCHYCQCDMSGLGLTVWCDTCLTGDGDYGPRFRKEAVDGLWGLGKGNCSLWKRGIYGIKKINTCLLKWKEISVNEELVLISLVVALVCERKKKKRLATKKSFRLQWELQ